MHLKKLGLILVLSVCLMVIGSGAATARPINPIDYFAPGKIDENSSDENSSMVTGQWIYEYTQGPIGTFTVQLKGWRDETGEHRNYFVDGDLNQPFFKCDIGRRSMTIIDAWELEGFDIWVQGELTPSLLKTDTPIPIDGTDYAWYITLHRRSFLTYKSWLTLVVLDRSHDPVPYTHNLVYLDPNDPDHQGRVVCYADFVKDVGLINYEIPDYTNYIEGYPNTITWVMFELISVSFFP